MTLKTYIFLTASLFSSHLMAANNTIFADVRLTYIDVDESQFSWRRKDNTIPKYPVKLARKGIAGCSVLKITINENGRANIDETLSYLPNKAILKESQKLVKSWKWQKKDELNQSEATVRIDYCMGGASIEQAQQRCVQQSKMQCVSKPKVAP